MHEIRFKIKLKNNQTHNIKIETETPFDKEVYISYIRSIFKELDSYQIYGN